ncbi:hypothetical protein [Aquibacillus rhizosphaerae]|uniref:Tfp pilus assembly protein PilN n=1 Tax=Aquibacillus rhizosphaerae TaxID=3051431 RepID=A0ABT7L8X3_9BACI|nr:hypothetical protein [Aquibacillus sp. LR5S19]MDL4841672.1 hypothetical protein [Aquibacillus sp. LR5S19]
MVEINFLERSKKNIVPYILVVLLVLLLGITVVGLQWQVSYQEEQLSSYKDQLNANLEEQRNLENIEGIQNQRQTLKEQVNEVELSIFPTLSILDKMIILLPEKAYFENYTFTIQDGLYLDIRVESVEQVAAYTNILEMQNFVEVVDVSTINQTDSGYIASLYVALNEQSLTEEASDNDD